MKTNGWVEAAKILVPHMVKLEIPNSQGSGFFIAVATEGKAKCAVIATAAHVIGHACKWSEPIIVTGYKRTVTLMPDQYLTQINESLDLAILEVPWDAVDFPAIPLPTTNPKDEFPAGYPVAWCGFPNMANDINCLFSGHISASVVSAGDYLVDGVVIHGVSGGPAFICDNGHVTIIGLLSQYLPNRETGESLPGLGVIKRINPLAEYFDDHKKVGKRKVRRE
jgi:hypothetical protein